MTITTLSHKIANLESHVEYHSNLANHYELVSKTFKGTLKGSFAKDEMAYHIDKANDLVSELDYLHTRYEREVDKWAES